VAAARGRWIPIVYYYLATLVGLVILLVGVIGGLQSLVDVVFPQLSSEVRFAEPTLERGPDSPGVAREPTDEERESARADSLERARLGGYAGGLRGLIAALVGAPVFLWHLRQARRKEPEWFATGGPASASERS
jgi:hypothetical protein